MPKPTTDASWEVEISEKTGRPIRWNGQNFQYYKKLMEIAARKTSAELFQVMVGDKKYDENFTDLQKSAWEAWQVDIQELIFSSVCTDMGQQLMDLPDGTSMWKYLRDRYEGTANEQTKAMTKRQLYAQLESAKCKQTGKVEGHLNYMCRLKGRLNTVGMILDDAVFNGMLVSSLPSNERFDRLRGFVDAGMDCVDTPEKVVAMAITFDKANQADSQLHRSFGNDKQSSSHKNKGGGGGGQDKGANEQGYSKGQGKTRACFVCGSTDHIKVNCPEKAAKSSNSVENEQKRKPQGNCTLRQDRRETRSEPPVATEGVVAGVARADTEEETSEDVLGAGHEETVADEETHASDQVNNDTSSAWWYFDTASNSHVTGRRSYYVSFTEDTSNVNSVRGVSPSLASRIEGVGTVALVNEIEGEQVMMFLDNVFYVPDAEYGLFSPGLAHEQGFEFDFDSATRSFAISREGRRVVIASPYEATWGFEVTHPAHNLELLTGPPDRALCNFTVAEGVGSLKLWHERMCHTCPQYLKTMVDRGLVKGMILTQRQNDTCDECHLGKQKKKKHQKKLDRATKEPNQVVYADLLFPNKVNGSRYEAILVIMDGYTRFVTIHFLKNKSSVLVNRHLKEYVLWAERQAGRMVKAVYTLKQFLTDKGGEFVNDETEAWYKAHGIEHIQVGPKSSQLNLCERTHQSLVAMTKATMLQAGFPRSLWPDAMQNAVYVKNRAYNKGTQGIPYEMFFGAKPDVHHIRKFGSLAYVHIPVTPGRRKQSNNAKIGYVLGYAENVVGCKIYFPDEHTAKFVSDLRVAEEVVYKDRHKIEAAASDLSSLHFATEESSTEATDAQNADAATTSDATMDAASELIEIDEIEELEEGVVDAVAQDDDDAQHESELQDGVSKSDARTAGVIDDVLTHEESSEQRECREPSSSISDGNDQRSQDIASEYGQVNPDTETNENGKDVSIAGTCGSSVGEDTSEDTEGESIPDDEDYSVRSIFGTSEDADSVASTPVAGVDFNQEEMAEKGVETEETRQTEVVDSSTIFVPQSGLIGKRTHREETSSAVERVEREAAKPEVKKTRTGLREYHERRRPRYLDDYVTNLTISNSRVLDKNGRPIRASDVKIPKNRREMLRSKWREFYLIAEMEEMAALRAK